MISTFSDYENDKLRQIFEHIGIPWQKMCKMSDKEAITVFLKYKCLHDSQKGPFAEYDVYERYMPIINGVNNAIPDHLLLHE